MNIQGLQGILKYHLSGIIERSGKVGGIARVVTAVVNYTTTLKTK